MHQIPTSRPTHGYMKFCTEEMNNHVSKYEELVHKTLQKMLHILVSVQIIEDYACDYYFNLQIRLYYLYTIPYMLYLFAGIFDFRGQGLIGRDFYSETFRRLIRNCWSDIPIKTEERTRGLFKREIGIMK